MKLVTFIFGLIIGAILAFGFVIYWQSQEPPDETNIVFARKNFFDAKQNNEFDTVFISGTLTGKDQRYSNNTYGISCIKRFNTCFVAYVEQIGRDQIGRIQNPIDYPVVKWSENEVVAQEEPTPLDCVRVTITIDRKREELLWVEEPANQTNPSCKNVDTSIRKYSIEDSPRWKQISGKK